MAISNQKVFASLTLALAFAVPGLLPQSGFAQTPTPAATPTYYIPSSGGNAAGSASRSQALQIVGMATSVGMGIYLAPNCPAQHWGKCAMSVLSFVQAGMMLSSAKGAGNAASGMSTGAYTGATVGSLYDGTNYGSGTTGSGSELGTDPSCPNCSSGIGGYTGPNVSQLMKDYQKLGENLKNAGVSINGKNMTLPNGKTISMDSLTSEQGMRDAGFTQDDIDASKAAMAKASAAAKDKFKAIAMAAEGGGGGGKGSGANGAGGAGGMNGMDPSDLLKRMSQGRERKAASVSGMSKKLGGDNIGVSGDDIFQMITRRYKARDAANQFLKD